MARPNGPSSPPGPGRMRLRGFLGQAVVASLLWLAFSGKYDLVHLAYGVVSVGIVLGLSGHLASYRDRPEQDEWMRQLRWARLPGFALWLLWQILLSNFHVAKQVLTPNIPVDPQMLKVPFPTQLEVAVTVIGNSITLTPGTITLEVKEGYLVVHALDRVSMAALMKGDMQRRVAALFGLELAGEPWAMALDENSGEG